MLLRGLLLFGLLLTAAFSLAGQTTTSDPQGERRSYVQMFQFSSDGKTVFSYTFGGTLLAWDLASRKLLHSQQVKADDLAFDPQGKLLSLVPFDEGIRLVDAARNQEVKTLQIPDFSFLSGFALSPDGKILAFTEGNYSEIIKLWDVTTGKEKVSLKISNPDTDTPRTMLFSADGATLAGLSRSITFWSTATGKPSGVIKVNAGLVRMAFTPDGKICVSGFDNIKPAFIKCFATASGSEVLSVPADASSPFAFSPDGKVLALYRHDHGLFLVSVATGKEIGTLRVSADQNSFTQMSFSPDGKLLAIAAMEGLVLIDPVAKKELFILAQPPPTDGP